MWSAPAALHATHLTFDPTACLWRCASELNPTTKVQKLLNGGFSNLDGIDMGHKGYFLRLLQLMSYKNKQRQWWTPLHGTAWSSHHGGDIFHMSCTFFTSQIRCKLSKIAVLDCKNHLNTVLKISTLWSLVAQRRSHASGVKGQTRRVTGSGSTSHRITKSWPRTSTYSLSDE